MNLEDMKRPIPITKKIYVGVRISKEQKQFIKENNLCISKIFRTTIDELMKQTKQSQ